MAKPNLTFSRKFYDLGSALGKGGSLATVGAQGGSLAVTFAALDRVGASLVDQGYKQQAAQVLDQAKRNGASEADMAAQKKRMIQLRQDETLAAEKFNAGAKQAYMSQLKAHMQDIGKVMSARYPTDPAKFGQDFTNATNALVEQLPPEWKDGAARAMHQYGGQLKTGISVAALKQQNDEHNATLFTAQNTAEADMMQAARDGNGDGVNTANAVYERKRGSRTDLNAQQIVEDTLRVNNQLQRNIALGGLDRVIKSGGLESAATYIEGVKNDHKTIPDPTQRDRVVAEMKGVAAEQRRVDAANANAGLDAIKTNIANVVNKADPGSLQSIADAYSILDTIKGRSTGKGANSVAANKEITNGLNDLQKMSRNVLNVRAARQEREAVKAYPVLYQKALDGTLTLAQFDGVKRDAILAGASEPQLQLLNSVADTLTKRNGGPSGLRSDKIYGDIVAKLQNFGIKSKSGAIVVSGDAPASGLIELQRQVIEAANLGQISHQEARSFLTKVIPSMTQQVKAENGQNNLIGLGGGPTDVYDAGFQSIVTLLQNNGQEDNIGLKTALFRTFVFRAEALNIDQQQDPAKRTELQDALARQMSAEYAKKIAPSLGGLSPDSLPNGIFVDGKLYSIFGGMSAAPTAAVVNGIDTRRLRDGTIVQVVKGTNILIRTIHKGSAVPVAQTSGNKGGNG